MESVIRNIKRPMLFEGAPVENLEHLLETLQNGQSIKLVLPAQIVQHSLEEPRQDSNTGSSLTVESMRVNGVYTIKVRQYMTKPATEEFDFQEKWNSNIPMPFRIMRGRVLKETRGMVMMDLCAVPMKTDVCMRCGRPLSHPVSRLYGIGPECGGHAHINPFDTPEQLFEALDVVKEKLAQIKWRGWIIKSAIEEVIGG